METRSDPFRLILPPELYPPDKDRKDETLDAIVKAAQEQADTYLVKKGGREQIVNKVKEIHYQLKCELGFPYRGTKDGKENDSHGYLPGIKDDKMVGSHKGSGKGRGNPGQPRRTVTTKRERVMTSAP